MTVRDVSFRVWCFDSESVYEVERRSVTLEELLRGGFRCQMVTK